MTVGIPGITRGPSPFEEVEQTSLEYGSQPGAPGVVPALSLGMVCPEMASQAVWNLLSSLFLIVLSTPLFSLGK